MQKLGLTVAAVLWLSLSPAWSVDYSWKDPVNGLASNPNNWAPSGIPDSSSLVTLPAFSNQSYTVTHDATWTIGDLKAYGYSTAHLSGHNLTVNSGGDFYNYSTLKLTNATYNPTGTVYLRDSATLRLENGTVSGSVGTSTGSHIYGYGSITNLPSNDGETRAQGGTLTIALGANSNEGILAADTGATLYVPAQANLSNHDTISLNGGTLRGYSASYQLLNYASGDVISGFGTIRDFKVNVGAGTLTATGGTLTLLNGFYQDQTSGTVNVQSGTLDVQGSAWINYTTISMSNGAITGQTMSQNATLNATSGANSVQNVTFYNGAAVSANTSLTVTGTGTLNGATITSGGAGAGFNVGSGATVQGRGTINPNMTNNGTLAANQNGETLTLNGTLAVNAGRSAYASNGGTLKLNNSTTNDGALYASGGTLTVDAALNSNGNLYATSSGTANVNSSLTVGSGGNAYATGGGTLNLAGAVYNRGNVSAQGGPVNINGTIKAGASETGDFAATNGTMSINGTIEAGVRNTFTAGSGGTINLPGSPSTGNLYATDALRPRGGTITVNSGQTLTNASGKVISGYGTLIGSGRTLSNAGQVLSANGGLSVAGDVVNTGLIEASGANPLQIQGTTTNQTNGVIRSAAGAAVSLGTVINDGLIEIASGGGGGGSVSFGQASGNGRYSLNGGTMVFTQNLEMSSLAAIEDHFTAATVRVFGNLSKAQGAMETFDADHVLIQVFTPEVMVGVQHNIAWGGVDMGAVTDGLIDNLAVGHLSLGDGFGKPASDTFLMSPDSILYCYGLTINADADLDLGGATIYYLRHGVEFNGITGQGFEDLGHWSNGQIIEIVPEPTTLMLLIPGGWVALRRRARSTQRRTCIRV